jgi:uroporphyrinogen-III synthase
VNADAGFGGLAVVSFESRRAPEMASFIARHGGAPVSAPTMREAAREDTTAALRFAEGLRGGVFDVVVLMTGVGTRALLDAIAPVMPREEVVERLAGLVVLARGPKPSLVLRELGLRGFLTAPEPNTHREVLATLAPVLAPGARVVVQEHGEPSEELYAGLAALGATVHAVPVYRWELPEDTTPLEQALRGLARGELRVALFTSAQQVRHALLVAERMGLAAEVRAALRCGVVASVGPVCSAALSAAGLAPDVEPEHPKMGHLVREAAAKARAVLAAKDA